MEQILDQQLYKGAMMLHKPNEQLQCMVKPCTTELCMPVLNYMCLMLCAPSQGELPGV